MAHRHRHHRTSYADPEQPQGADYRAEKLATQAYYHAMCTGADAVAAQIPSPKRRSPARKYTQKQPGPSPHSPKRSSSPDSDYISRPASYEDEYIQPRSLHDDYAARHPAKYISDHPLWHDEGFSVGPDFDRSRGLRTRKHADFVEARRHRDEYRSDDYRGDDYRGDDYHGDDYHGADHRVAAQQSDIEDSPGPARADTHITKSTNYVSDEDRGRKSSPWDGDDCASDVVSRPEKLVGSDIASLRSADSRRPGSVGAASDVQERGGGGGGGDGESDNEGYATHGDCIDGDSDCISNASSSGRDSGSVYESADEGSDMMSGSDVGAASDIAPASDVAPASAVAAASGVAAARDVAPARDVAAAEASDVEDYDEGEDLIDEEDDYIEDEYVPGTGHAQYSRDAYGTGTGHAQYSRR